MSLLSIVRWIHIISGVAWLGEVITVNFVLVPIVIKLSKQERGAFIGLVFPRVFRLASVLAGTAIISGAIMNYLITGWTNLGVWLGTRQGIAILIGGTLGLLLALFHFFVEHRLEPTAVSADQMSEADTEKMLAVLKLVPRVGMIVVALVILLMMFAARGI